MQQIKQNHDYLDEVVIHYAFIKHILLVFSEHRFHLLDSLIHERLCEHRLIEFIVALTSIAYQVDDYVLNIHHHQKQSIPASKRDVLNKTTTDGYMNHLSAIAFLIRNERKMRFFFN